tara:strand:+ start:854 stop:1663 length:810 start_codon:yes stop_codon:yes gene_type:complete
MGNVNDYEAMYEDDTKDLGHNTTAIIIDAHACAIPENFIIVPDGFEIYFAAPKDKIVISDTGQKNVVFAETCGYQNNANIKRKKRSAEHMGDVLPPFDDIYTEVAIGRTRTEYSNEQGVFNILNDDIENVIPDLVFIPEQTYGGDIAYGASEGYFYDRISVYEPMKKYREYTLKGGEKLSDVIRIANEIILGNKEMKLANRLIESDAFVVTDSDSSDEEEDIELTHPDPPGPPRPIVKIFVNACREPCDVKTLDEFADKIVKSPNCTLM